MNQKIYPLVADILENSEIKNKYNNKKHIFSKWIKHTERTIAVSYYLAKLTGANTYTTIRAAALHDIADEPQFNHSKKCAIEASKLENNSKVIKAVETHMFPLSKLPESKEAWVLAIADKVINFVDLFDF